MLQPDLDTLHPYLEQACTTACCYSGTRKTTLNSSQFRKDWTLGQSITNDPPHPDSLWFHDCHVSAWGCRAFLSSASSPLIPSSPHSVAVAKKPNRDGDRNYPLRHGGRSRERGRAHSRAPKKTEARRGMGSVGEPTLSGGSGGSYGMESVELSNASKTAWLTDPWRCFGRTRRTSWCLSRN